MAKLFKKYFLELKKLVRNIRRKKNLNFMNQREKFNFKRTDFKLTMPI